MPWEEALASSAIPTLEYRVQGPGRSASQRAQTYQKQTSANGATKRDELDVPRFESASDIAVLFLTSAFIHEDADV